jgi:murein DD-endopeptidase MepM/ murein hydrolase activator NlpD
MVDAERSKDQYDLLLQQSLQAEQQAGATITSLERQLQNSLGGGQPNYTSTGYIWPVRGTITAYYRDPSYPFRCTYFRSPSCLEHTGVDIGVPQGTPVRATADGTVAAFTSYNTTQLNYVSLFHGSGITSRYLHLNRVLVGAEQFVKQGDIIGYSGGMPGTAGSGGLTTGPHLHFEIRVDGLPDDPLRYLN